MAFPSKTNSKEQSGGKKQQPPPQKTSQQQNSKSQIGAISSAKSTLQLTPSSKVQTNLSTGPKLTISSTPSSLTQQKSSRPSTSVIGSGIPISSRTSSNNLKQATSVSNPSAISSSSRSTILGPSSSSNASSAANIKTTSTTQSKVIRGSFRSKASSQDRGKTRTRQKRSATKRRRRVRRTRMQRSAKTEQKKSSLGNTRSNDGKSSSISFRSISGNTKTTTRVYPKSALKVSGSSSNVSQSSRSTSSATSRIKSKTDLCACGRPTCPSRKGSIKDISSSRSSTRIKCKQEERSKSGKVLFKVKIKDGLKVFAPSRTTLFPDPPAVPPGQLEHARPRVHRIYDRGAPTSMTAEEQAKFDETECDQMVAAIESNERILLAEFQKQLQEEERASKDFNAAFIGSITDTYEQVMQQVTTLVNQLKPTTNTGGAGTEAPKPFTSPSTAPVPSEGVSQPSTTAQGPAKSKSEGASSSKSGSGKTTSASK